MTLLEYIKEKRGNAKLLAEKLDISPSFLSQLASGEAPISPARGVLIETLTEGKVSRKEMFPDSWEGIWPELLSDKRTAGGEERGGAPGRRTNDAKIGRRTRKKTQ